MKMNGNVDGDFLFVAFARTRLEDPCLDELHGFFVEVCPHRLDDLSMANCAVGSHMGAHIDALMPPNAAGCGDFTGTGMAKAAQ